MVRSLQTSRRRSSTSGGYGRRSSTSSFPSISSSWMRRAAEASWRNRDAIMGVAADLWDRRHSGSTSTRRPSTPMRVDPPFPHTLSRIKGRSTARYAGKFKKKRKSRIVKPLTIHQKRGFSFTTETHGDVQDPHCVYLVHSTYAQFELCKAILGALMRAVLNAANITVTNKDAVLKLGTLQTGEPTAQNHRFVLTTFNNLTHTYERHAIATQEGSSFQSILNTWDNAFNFLLSLLRGANGWDIYDIQLVESETTGNTNAFHTKARIYQEDMSLSVMTDSVLTIQNRTSGAFATGDAVLSADRIDNQPLHGFIYTLKNGDPRFKPVYTIADRPFNQIDIHGGNLSRADDLPVTFQEPPVPSSFSNLKSYSKVNLDPGFIKKSSIHWALKGKLKTVMYKLINKHFVNLPDVGPNNNFVVGVPGQCQIIALEEKIRTNSTNVLTVTYERQNTLAAMIFVKKTSVPLQTDFRDSEISKTS